LFNLKLYLCGPINGRTDSECNDWRAQAKAIWPGKTLDPMRRDYRGHEEQAFREIVENDKADISACDALLVYFDRPSVGTSMEVLYAWGQKIPVVVVDVSDKPISPWLRYHATRITPSIPEAIKELSCLLK
jgi:nucleoside 2-deoxyribosyltransferase